MQRPHASRPRGPPNWLQDRGREGGRGRGGGDPAAAATPPAVPAPAGAGRSRSDLGCGGSELCASPGGHAVGFCSPGGCSYASSEKDFRAENSQDSDTSKAGSWRAAIALTGPSLGYRETLSEAPVVPDRSSRSLHLPNFGRSERSLWSPYAVSRIWALCDHHPMLPASAWGSVARLPRSILSQLGPPEFHSEPDWQRTSFTPMTEGKNEATALMHSIWEFCSCWSYDLHKHTLSKGSAQGRQLFNI